MTDPVRQAEEIVAAAAFWDRLKSADPEASEHVARIARGVNSATFERLMLDDEYRRAFFDGWEACQRHLGIT